MSFALINHCLQVGVIKAVVAFTPVGSGCGGDHCHGPPAFPGRAHREDSCRPSDLVHRDIVRFLLCGVLLTCCGLYVL